MEGVSINVTGPLFPEQDFLSGKQRGACETWFVIMGDMVEQPPMYNAIFRQRDSFPTVARSNHSRKCGEQSGAPSLHGA